MNTHSIESIGSVLQRALFHHQRGELAEAEVIYRQVLQSEPRQPDALRLLGLLCRQRGDLALAQHFLKQALHAPTVSAEACHAIGLAFDDLGRSDAAVASYEKALRLQPNHAPSLLQLGIAFEKQNRFAEAESCLRKFVTLEPTSALAHLKLAALLEASDRLEEAQAHAECAVRCAPEVPEACLSLGTILIRRNRISDSVPFFNRAVQLDPAASASAAEMLRAVLNEATQKWEARLASDPADFESLLSLAKIRYSEKNPLEAIDLLERALSIRPGEPNAEYALAFTELLLGRFEAGWKHYEARLRTGQPQFPNRTFLQPRWEGENLVGRTILVHAEQGVGDTIQFARYLSLVAQRGAHVLLECQPTLKPLLELLPDVHGVIGQGETLPPFDVQVPLLSLPAIFDTTLKSIPNQVPRLRVPDGVRFELPEAAPGKLKVGIVWAGNPALQNDLVRSFPLNHLAPLLSMPNFSFFSLQVGPASRQLASSKDASKVIDLRPMLSDFGKTASAIERLDLIISVDTAVAHLAGALGKPVWLLLPFAPEWRWLLDREDSPWYASMRLFRQAKPEDWDGVVQRLSRELLKKM